MSAKPSNTDDFTVGMSDQVYQVGPTWKDGFWGALLMGSGTSFHHMLPKTKEHYNKISFHFNLDLIFNFTSFYYSFKHSRSKLGSRILGGCEDYSHFSHANTLEIKIITIVLSLFYLLLYSWISKCNWLYEIKDANGYPIF